MASTVQDFVADGKVAEGLIRSEIGEYIQWAVFGIFIASSFVFLVWNKKTPQEHKKYFYLTFSVTFAAALSYLTMAVGSFVSVSASGREFAPARYADWLVTTPLLLLDLGLLAGVPLAENLQWVFLDVAMVVAGAAAAYSTTEVARWSLFAFSCVAMLPVVIAVVTRLREVAEHKGEEVEDRINALAWLTFATWILYPVVWGLGEGAGVISVDFEIILYAILDVTAKAVFGFILLANHAELHLPKTVPQIQLPLTYQA